LPIVASVALVTVTACATHQTGPNRPITIADDVDLARTLVERRLTGFYSADLTTQALHRNEVLTARMFISDVEYHAYEAQLTKDIQQEGLAATLASLGLTTSATLLSPPGTKTILSGIATAVTGADKAFNEKVLLSNTIQALQTQMRADRKTQASVIYAKMFKNVDNSTRVVTPIIEYTLPMALSDVDTYYQAGTVASALIGLSKTVANADRNADEAKSISGPNPVQVTTAKTTAAPVVAAPATPTRTVRIATVSTDTSYRNLRAQIFPGGSATPDAEIVAYIREILGPPPIAIGVILNQPGLAPLRQRISACIVARAAGNKCAPNSLGAFR
jgi:hypothetical protein